MKKLFALLVCLSLLLVLLAGCGSGTKAEIAEPEAEPAVEAEAEPEPETDIPADGTVADEETPVDVNVAGVMTGGTGYETYAPDTIVGTVADSEVTWMEYFYWLNYYTNYYVTMAAQSGVILSSWDAVGELSSQNANGDALIAMTEYTIQQYHALMKAADEADVTLSEDEAAQLQDMYDSYCDTDGDGEVTEEEEAEFLEYLDEQHVDKEFFLYLNTVALLSDKLFDVNYGPHGEYCSDDIANSYIDNTGILNAKHILLLTVDSSTREALDEDTIAQKRETIDTLMAELDEKRDDQDAMIALFDEYMENYTEDTGYAANPDGYVFVEGDMVQEFEDTVKELDPNYGLSEVVESPYGYHIILRQPVTPDTVVGTNSMGEEVNIRFVAAEEQYSAMINAWTESATCTWDSSIVPPDMAAIFG